MIKLDNNLFKRNIKYVTSTIIILLIATLGVRILLLTHAQSPSTTVNASSGSLSSPATLTSDTTAYNGSSVQFGKLSTLLPPSIPTNGAYLGGWINPGQVSGSGSTLGCVAPNTQTGCIEIAQLPAFNQSVGKTVRLLHLYASFKGSLPTTTLAEISANGSIPLLDWNCSDVAAISNGSEDSIITSYADGIKTFGKPVFLRWFWEMNLTDPNNINCGAYGNGPAYIAAWQHIWNIFHNEGASNASFVWCPSIQSDGAQYYPGDKYVDWISVDGYDRKAQGINGFSAIFGGFYNQWSGHGKPILIGETAAFNNSADNSAEQAQYILGIEKSIPAQFPDIKGIVYFDSIGPAGDWSLQGSGTTAFKTLANDPYFTYIGN